MLRRISWPGIVVGAVVALLAGWLMLLATADLYSMIAWEEGPGGVGRGTGEMLQLATYVSILVSFISWYAAYFLGGLVSGRVAAYSPGINGALVAVLIPALGTIALVALMLPVLFSEGLSFAFEPENLGKLFYFVAGFAVFFPLGVLAAYIGGRVVGRLRAQRSARAGA